MWASLLAAVEKDDTGLGGDREELVGPTGSGEGVTVMSGVVQTRVTTELVLEAILLDPLVMMGSICEAEEGHCDLREEGCNVPSLDCWDNTASDSFGCGRSVGCDS